MPAKQLKFAFEARDKMLRGIDTLAGAVRVTLGPRDAMSRSTSPSGRASPRMASPSLMRSSSRTIREHGRADGKEVAPRPLAGG